MIREVVKIDEELCDGCGNCIPNCHEGALQMIDGKARLISDLLCDGLGACIGHCPQGAITIEKREAEPYDEVKAIQLIIPKGKNTVVAHLKHLRDHNETGYMKEAIEYMRANKETLPFDLNEVIREMHKPKIGVMNHAHAGGCPGSQSRTIQPEPQKPTSEATQDVPSQLRQWPVQMHLINPAAGYFKNSDMVLAADCVAFAMGDFHSKLLKGKTLGIACPKLDNGMEIYMEKIIRLIDEAQINTLTVVMMEVPCCGGLLQIAQRASSMASRKVPIKKLVISVAGETLSEEWV
ncbi:ATP-binding protein [Marinilabilia rubra]|uniref:4Fe-4S ferredoxin n=1 Tax=Marinilabilia rubra TaxID=2162893 RepID=A0A2U2BCZ2_9BACT|nr:4Fe-4S binding protein [Marinilabilia rubra]PWE00897.1 4Fe-4S ferredoxin [Marinilabilia rubra]